MAAGKRTQRCISLALQGGGSFGAFTWGVLDRFLQEPGLALDMVSGASAGAINAVVLADGLAAGGRDGARRKLARVWRRVSDASPLRGPAVAMAAGALELSSHLVSPRQMNPLGLDPLRDILEDEVDFPRLRASSPIRLLIAATRVRDGRARLFREDEITLSALLASACLPAIHPPVEVDGEAYWDGGFSANPPLRDLVCDTTAKEIVLVTLLPDDLPESPSLPSEISRRVREIGFNASLLHEEESLEALRRACAEQRLFRSALCRKLARIHISRLSAGDMRDLSHESPLDTSWPFLDRMKTAGRRAAQQWLQQT